MKLPIDMQSHDPYEVDDYKDIIKDLDNMERTVTDWEEEFIDGLLHQDDFSIKQKEILRRMERRYL